MKTFHSELVFVAFLTLAFTPTLRSQTPAPKENPMHGTGSFDVKTIPQDDKSDDPALGRFLLDKQYHGDLEATGKGQMLTAGTSVKGSGAYVAIEKVTGTLKGRSGTFVLQHTGSMSGGNFHLNLTIVSDSGTGQLTGIAGTMKIIISPDGKHSYDLEYALPAAN